MEGQYELSDLSSQLNSDLYNQLFSTQGFTPIEENGFSGFFTNPWSGFWEGNKENGNQMYNYTPTQGAMDTFKDFSFNWTPGDNPGSGVLDAFDPKGQSYGKFKQEGSDWMDQLAGMVIPAFVTGGFGSALGGMFGGGIVGNAAGQGLAGGVSSSMQGGKFGEGLLSGLISGGLQGMAQGTPAVQGNNPSAYVPGTPGTSLAGAAGITNPTLAGMFNRGVGTTLGGLAGGKSLEDAARSGLVGAGLAGVNSLGKSVMNDYMSSLKSWMGTPDTAMASGSMSDELDALGGNMVSDPMDQSVAPEMYSDEGARFDNSADFSYGFQPTAFLGGATPDQSIQSVGQSDFSLPSIFGNAGSRLGNFALNNVGDLASMLYGFYNNRRQQKALGQQVSSLQGLYGQNSPYAAQLRNTLNAKAAQSGRRSNVAGRETQFQAMLADRAASMAPTLMQLNQARGSLKNNNMNMLLQGARKLGVFDGLGGLFGNNNNPYANYSMSQNPSDYNILGVGRP